MGTQSEYVHALVQLKNGAECCFWWELHAIKDVQLEHGYTRKNQLQIQHQGTHSAQEATKYMHKIVRQTNPLIKRYLSGLSESSVLHLNNGG